MDDGDTARSGFVDQDLSEVSEVNVPLRDPIDWFDPGEADVSISNKGEIFKLPDFTLQLSFAGYEVHGDLMWIYGISEQKWPRTLVSLV